MRHWNKVVSSASPAYWWRKVGNQWKYVSEMGDEPVAQVLIEWKKVAGRFTRAILLDIDDEFRIWFASDIEYELNLKKMPQLPQVSAKKKTRKAK